MWSTLQNNIGKDVFLKINNNEIKCKITDCNILADDCKWVSFSAYEKKELTPVLFGYNLGNFNCLFSPKDKRSYKGWFSDEVFDTLRFTS